MRAFVCPVCSSLLSFEDRLCVTCRTDLAYDGSSLVPASDVALCTNRDAVGCNWVAYDSGLCRSCALTRTRPHDLDTAGLASWAVTEAAKRRMLYQLDDLGLASDTVTFDLLSSHDRSVTTGHADGVITIDLAEGDDVHRESVRIGLGESYRTMLGHLRHEIGHFYWQELLDGTDRLGAFRAVFGDDREDYAAALERHYAAADDRSWAATHLTRYAASHPWEDWAESFAHVLHIRDTSQTAAAWRLAIGGPVTAPPVRDVASMASVPADEPADFDAMVATWLPFSYALNAVNRSLGQEDAYPFVLAPPVLDKLRFVDDTIRGAA